MQDCHSCDPSSILGVGATLNTEDVRMGSER